MIVFVDQVPRSQTQFGNEVVLAVTQARGRGRAFQLCFPCRSETEFRRQVRQPDGLAEVSAFPNRYVFSAYPKLITRNSGSPQRVRPVADMLPDSWRGHFVRVPAQVKSLRDTSGKMPELRRSPLFLPRRYACFCGFVLGKFAQLPEFLVALLHQLFQRLRCDSFQILAQSGS